MNAYKKLLTLFSGHLDGYLKELKDRKPTELYEPERYILSLGGKRVRPLLSLIACDLLGGEAKRALPCALAVELFHNFSLIHDDILDAAPLRRGNATVHHKYGNNVAILAGDAMLVKAMSSLQDYPDPAFRELSALLQRTSIEVCEGQQLDMNFEHRDDVSVEEYVEMITLKTAVLLGCSLKMGATCAGASAKDRELLYDFGKHLGIAFQLLDDLLDCFPATSSFGKKIGGDIASNKKTFLWLKALELAKPAVKKELLALGAQKEREAKIKPVLEIYTRLGVDRLCRKEADRHTSLAIKKLNGVNGAPEKRAALENFALGLLARES